MKNWKVQAGLLGVVLLGMVAFLVFASGKAKTDSQPEQKAPPPRAERQEPAASPPQEPEAVVEPEPIPEPEPEPKPEPEPTKPLTGLAIVRETYFANEAEYEVFCFNPDTKEENLITDFQIPSQAPDNNIYRAGTHRSRSDPICRWDFSSDYTKLAGQKLLTANGEWHAGWHNKDSTFIDVTEALGLHSKSDFDDPVSHDSTGFAGDLFGYNFPEKFSKKEFYVPVNNLSSDAVREGNVLEVGHPYNENGTLLAAGGIFGKYYSREVTSWIDDTRAIANYITTNLHYYSFIVDTAAQTETAYIPGDSRYNWNGVISPDGTKIAFMSMTEKGEAQTDIYIVPVEGGDPVKVEGLSYDLKGKHATDQGNCTLIDWI